MKYIYKTTNTITGTAYIGQRTTSIEIEKDSYLGSGTLLLQSIKKYGRKNFKKEILHICENQKQADDLEIQEIEKHRALYGRMSLYNMSGGGQYWRDENHGKAISEKMKKYYSIQENKQHFIQKKIDTQNKKRIEKGLQIFYTDIETLQKYKEKRIYEIQIERAIKKKEKEANSKINQTLRMAEKMKLIYINSFKKRATKMQQKYGTMWVNCEKISWKEKCKREFYNTDTQEKFSKAIAGRAIDREKIGSIARGKRMEHAHKTRPHTAHLDEVFREHNIPITSKIYGMRNKWDRVTKREASREMFLKYIQEFSVVFGIHGKIDAAQALKEYEEK